MPDLMTVLPFVVVVMVIGALGGILAGLLGVGGGIVLVPAFFYAFSALGYNSPYLMQICVATSLATIIVTSLRSLQSHNKKGAVDWAILKGWAPGIVLGAGIGVLIAAKLSSTALQAVFGVAGMIVGLYMGFGRGSWRLADAMPVGATRAALSPSLGFLSVLMGIGGGSFGVPLMSLYNVAIHRAVATAAGFGVIIAVPSVLGFLFFKLPPEVTPPYTVGAVNLIAFVLTISMTLITTPIGVRLAHWMDPTPLKRIFAVFLTLVAVNMLRGAIWG